MFIPMLLGQDELGAEYDSSLFGNTQFDVAVKNLKSYFKALNDPTGNTIDVKRMLADYVFFALNGTEPYVSKNLEQWVKRFMSKGYERGQAILFLSALKKGSETGTVGDAVFAPYDWSLAHPEKEFSIQGILDSAKDALSLPGWVKPAAIGIAILGVLYIARPYMIAGNSAYKALQKRKQA